MAKLGHREPICHGGGRLTSADAPSGPRVSLAVVSGGQDPVERSPGCHPLLPKFRVSRPPVCSKLGLFCDTIVESLGVSSRTECRATVALVALGAPLSKKDIAMAKGQEKPKKNNKEKLTTKEKQQKKKEKQAAKGK
jgi:hypothetical protein